MRTRASSEHHDVVTRRIARLRAEVAESAPMSLGEDDDALDGVLRPVEDSPDGQVPVPGRHAHRRLDPGAVVPEPLRGRVAIGPWHLVVIAVVIVVGLVVTCWWLLRGVAEPGAASVTPGQTGEAAPLVTPSGDAAPSAAGSARGPGGDAATDRASPAASVTVDVEGKVRRPGIAVLPEGARVVDAVEAAGGATERRHLAGLNLAAVLTDGEQIVVGVPGAQLAVPPSVGTTSGAGPDEQPLVSINTATGEELETLPGVGPVTAQAILDWRSDNGGFSSVEELLEVDGIGDKTLEDLRPHVTL